MAWIKLDARSSKEFLQVDSTELKLKSFHYEFTSNYLSNFYSELKSQEK